MREAEKKGLKGRGEERIYGKGMELGKRTEKGTWEGWKHCAVLIPYSILNRISDT